MVGDVFVWALKNEIHSCHTRFAIDPKVEKISGNCNSIWPADMKKSQAF